MLLQLNQWADMLRTKATVIIYANHVTPFGEPSPSPSVRSSESSAADAHWPRMTPPRDSVEGSPTRRVSAMSLLVIDGFIMKWWIEEDRDDLEMATKDRLLNNWIWINYSRSPTSTCLLICPTPTNSVWIIVNNLLVSVMVGLNNQIIIILFITSAM